MQDEIFSRRHMIVGASPEEKILYRRQFQRIVEDFEKKTQTYNIFLSYCKKCRESPDEAIMSQYPFSRELQSSIDKFTEFGPAFFDDVLIALLKQHGLAADNVED